MRKTNKLPDLSYLHECFHIKNDELYWSERPKYHFKTLNAWSTFISRDSKNKAGNIVNSGHFRVMLDGKKILVHRIIFAMSNGFDPYPFMVDHKDGNPSNNAIENLRLAKNGQNEMNSKLHINNTSGIKGVSWNKRRNKWHAKIVCNKFVQNEFFAEIQDAVMWIYAKRTELHGEFARNS